MNLIYSPVVFMTLSAVSILPILYLAPTLLGSYSVTAKYQLKPVTIPANSRIFTDEQLSKFDGNNDEKLVYLAIKGVIFDVTSGGDFYLPGAAYNALAGKDCSRATAKMSLDPEDLNSDVSDLEDSYLESLDSIFEGTYMAKYPVVGYTEKLMAEQMQKHKLDL